MKRTAMTQTAGRVGEYQNFVFFFLVRPKEMKVKMLLNPVRRPRLFMSNVIQLPTVPGAPPSTLPTSDSGSNQKPHG